MKPEEVQENKNKKHWYKQRRYYVILLALVISISALSGGSGNSNQAEVNAISQQSASAVSGSNNILKKVIQVQVR